MEYVAELGSLLPHQLSHCRVAASLINLRKQFQASKLNFSSVSHMIFTLELISVSPLP